VALLENGKSYIKTVKLAYILSIIQALEKYLDKGSMY